MTKFGQNLAESNLDTIRLFKKVVEAHFWKRRLRRAFSKIRDPALLGNRGLRRPDFRAMLEALRLIFGKIAYAALFPKSARNRDQSFWKNAYAALFQNWRQISIAGNPAYVAGFPEMLSKLT